MIFILLFFVASIFYKSLSTTNIFVPDKLIGKNLPDFKAKSFYDKNKYFTKNEVFNEKKYYLLNIWASWCGPCRRENPNLVDAYKKYNKTKFKEGNGFEIYSLSLDKKQEAWVKAINQDQLFWEYHVSDLGGWQSEGSQKYGISSIPSNVIINGKGIIIAKNLKGQALHRFLDSQKK